MGLSNVLVSSPKCVPYRILGFFSNVLVSSPKCVAYRILGFFTALEQDGKEGGSTTSGEALLQHLKHTLTKLVMAEVLEVLVPKDKAVGSLSYFAC